jgi:hypothetical protein
MLFLFWHLLAILTVMTVSYIIGYSVGHKNAVEKRNFKLLDLIKNIFRR